MTREITDTAESGAPSSGQLIVESYRSLKGELSYLPAISPRRRRVFRALCRLEQRADHRRVHVERNAEPLPLDLSWEAPC